MNPYEQTLTADPKHPYRRYGDLKKCKSCKEIKSITGFSTYKRSPDNLQYSCKACQSKYAKENYARIYAGQKKWRFDNLESVRKQRKEYCEQRKEQKKEYDHEYQKKNREKINAGKRAWRAKNPDKSFEYTKKSQAKHPEKRVARRKLNRAIELGTIARMPCEVCGNSKVDAHHDDYTKPLEIRWLCRKHHAEHHHA